MTNAKFASLQKTPGNSTKPSFERQKIRNVAVFEWNEAK